jgi:DNA-binding NarL/FixJ family response regulator
VSATAATGSPITVALVDDQELFASGMEMLVDSQSDLEFVGSAHNGRDGVELAASARPDVVLMDIRMPVMDGIEATARISETQDGPKVIVLTTFQRDEAVFRAIRSGASGFITKDAKPEYVLDAIRLVHAGHSVLAPRATMELISEFAPSRENPDRREAAIAVLTPREQEIFLLAARGLSNAEIARAAFVSEATVKTHVRNILNKLKLSSRVQVVVFAYENGLVA